MIRPDSIAGSSEQSQQVAFFCWCSHPDVLGAFPELRWIHAIPNGGSRHKGEAAQLVAAGVRAGVPDVFLPAPNGEFYGLYIEFKAPGKLHATTQKQDEFAEFVKRQGYMYRVHDNWKDARDTIIMYVGDMPITDYNHLREI